jgi:ElaB/YqjD/DUF883 family membrane-anchored ribosome-binding protein
MVVRRILEAQTLAERAGLTDEIESELESALTRRAERATVLAQKLEAKDPDSAERLATEFDSILEAHSEILEDLGEKSGHEDTKRASGKFASRLRDGSYRFWSVRFTDDDVIALATEDSSPSGALATMMTESAPTEDSTLALRTEKAVVTGDNSLREENADAVAKFRGRAEKSIEDAYDDFEDVAEKLTSDEHKRIEQDLKKLTERLGNSSTLGDFARILQDSTRLSTFLNAVNRFKEQNVLQRFFNDDHDTGENEQDAREDRDSNDSSSEDSDDNSGSGGRD